MKVVIKGPFWDILSFLFHIKKRKRVFKKAQASPVGPGRMNILAEQLHPASQKFVMESVVSETADTNTYRLKGLGRAPAYFIPGQYISINFKIGDSTITRPFSISSLPQEAIDGRYYDITVRCRDDDGFACRWIMENWKPGSEVHTSGPAGTFTWERLRDCNNLVCMAGGSGITPFKPIIGSLLSDNPSVKVLLFQGERNAQGLIFRDFWTKLSADHPGRFFYVPVLSEPDNEWTGERGFITSELLLKTMNNALKIFEVENCSYFICGPKGLHDFMDTELSGLGISGKRIRKEEYAVNIRGDKNGTPGNPSVVSVSVRQGDRVFVIKAAMDETVLVSLERAGLCPPSLCRSGECGWCRSRLVSGDVSGRGRSGGSGLRKADEKFGYFHPCSVFPESDLVMEVPVNPVDR